MRHPSYFRVNETTREQRVQVITDFVRDVRKVLDAHARPGQRRWLCARVPCHVRLHDDLGIDLIEMVEAGLDMVNLSATYYTQQLHDVALVREMLPDTAIYLEMCHCTTQGLSVGGYGDTRHYRRNTDHQYYTTAHVAYRRGADGISLFNFVYTREHGQPGRGPFNEPPFHVLKHLGEPEWLARQPQWYFLAKAYHAPLPRRFTKGQTDTFTLDMAPTDHQTKDGLLRLMMDRNSSQCQWAAKLNGTALVPADFVRKPLDHPYEAGLGQPDQYACFTCPRTAVGDGPNRIALTLIDGDPVSVEYVDLVLP
jgi:hypothetical protein